MSTRRLHAIDARDAARSAERGALLLVDVREVSHLVDEQIPGALNLPLSGLESALVTWRPATPVAFLCRTGRLSAMAVKAARRAGLDAYFVDGGVRAWRDASLPFRRSPEADPTGLISPAQAWAADPAHVLVDLRDATAFERRRVPRSRSVPLEQLPEHVIELEQLGRPLIFICGNGRRSHVAAELLGRRGRIPVSYVPGGLVAWVAAGLPIDNDHMPPEVV